METTEFDATLGGAEHLPLSANNLKFAASRSVEIAAMTELILRPSTTKLIFQTLPVHMRRRAMSHNCKRLPRKLRDAYSEQLKKSGISTTEPKRPSRKHRRRPKYLLEEYNRRQKRNMWLETHIWHAKRFHMTERWGYRLANASCDKAFRACYRASSAHCLIQDISYLTPIQIEGPVDVIKDMFSSITNSSCNLGICAKAFISGNREGTVHIYSPNSYPFGYIGKAQYIWILSNGIIKYLWLYVHPAIAKQIESLLMDLLDNNIEYRNIEYDNKRRKVDNNYTQSVQIKCLSGTFNRFRMTGPNSHAVLVNSLKCIDDFEKIRGDDWVAKYDKSMLQLKEKYEYWSSISLASSPSQLPPHTVLGLVVRDPRLNRPSNRIKAHPKCDSIVNTTSLAKVSPCVSTSPLWNLDIHETIKENAVTNSSYIQHITRTQLVPGEINEDDPFLQSLPIVLIQRPGSQDSSYKKIGYGCGWDVIIPSSYGLAFWLTFIMFGARSGALRETESLAFEMGECYFPPDSEAGRAEHEKNGTELKDKYFRLPPSKRVNYTKLGISSPFISPWEILLQDWSEKRVEKFFVMRDRQILNNIQDCIRKKRCIPHIENSDTCLIAVYVQLAVRGNLKKNALICLPEPSELIFIKDLFEPAHDDPNEQFRKNKRAEHLKILKQLRKKRTKLRKKNIILEKKANKTKSKEPSQFVQEMRALWLPPTVKTVRYTNSHQIMGYICQGAFSFSEARSCGVGYVTYNALSILLNQGINQVLIRNTNSRKYRLANIHIAKH